MKHRWYDHCHWTTEVLGENFSIFSSYRKNMYCPGSEHSTPPLKAGACGIARPFATEDKDSVYHFQL